jgi:hypothetical protein
MKNPLNQANYRLSRRDALLDLLLSNPDSVRLYKLRPQQYLARLGCEH